MDCLFCRIANGTLPAQVVFEDEHTMAFLDHIPVFHGHTLVIPKRHVDTMLDLPPELTPPLMATTKLIGQAVEQGLGAEGSFVCVNVKVSQTVPHLHVHVMPRSKGDGMKGFFWPRRPYPSEEAREQTRSALAGAVQKIRGGP
jgi:histidine triad (HIT) family protein